MIRRIANFFNFLKSPEKTHPAYAGDFDHWTRKQLIDTIKELEMKIDKCSDKSSSEDINHQDKIEKRGNDNSSNQNKKKERKAFDFSKHSKRFVAIKFAYLGWNYNGLSFQLEPTPLPTVEEEILKALEKAKLIPSVDPISCRFSRCGRTDKGVSAMNQVIALDVRSNLVQEQQQKKEFDDKEIPYVSVLNSLLPKDIRITEICLRPPVNFDARFSCLYRHYRYIFHKRGLDLDLMKLGASKYEGTHDFRNFCKIDGSKQITNYQRHVISAKIIPFKDDYFFFDLKGSAFLWHQVRCMVAVLFMVGQKLEKPGVIDDLLNINKYPLKPSFEMANDIPLILYDCAYPEMEWLPFTYFKNVSSKIMKENSMVQSLVLDYQVKALIASMLQDTSVKVSDEVKTLPGAGFINIGDGKGRNFRRYTPIQKRECGDFFEVVNERHREKKKRKLDAGMPR